MKMKKIVLSIMAVLSISFAFNMYSIRACAEKNIATGETVSSEMLKKGDEFICEDYDLFTFRVVKTANESKSKFIEVELTGFNPSPGSQYTAEDYEDVVCENGYLDNYEIVGIADNAFKGNEKIRNFTISTFPGSYIGNSAFEGCTHLRKFNSDSVRLKRIGDRAFCDCQSMYAFQLNGNKLKSVGKDAFKNTGRVMMKLNLYDMKKKQMKKVKKLFIKAGAKNVILRKRTYVK